MRSGCLLARALLAAAALPALPGRAEEFQNPEVIRVKAPGAELTIRAQRGTAFIPGLGEVEQTSGYDVRRGTAFQPKGAGRVRLMPPVIAVDRGSTLRVLFRNELVTADVAGKSLPTESNLHTHGLTVSPKGTGFEGTGRERAYGDCIFVAATSGDGVPGHGHNPAKQGPGELSGDPCSLDSGSPFTRTERGDIRYSYVIARDHASGMYWFHPHPHGRSEGQVSNGLSGLMLIGSFWDYSYLKCRITALPDEPDACRDQEAQREELAAERHADSPGGPLKVRFLGLKDIQVSKLKRGPGGQGKPRFRMIEFPQPPNPSDRSAREAFGEQTDARKSRCGKLVASGSADGDLAYTDGVAFPGQCWRKDHPDERWVFPVSGQVHPRLTVRPGKTEVWHLGNIGADVTYRLRLETIEAKPRRLAFEVRALDGAPIPADRQNRRPTEIVLMPGARIDVLVARCSQAAGTSTGNDSSNCVEASQTVQARLYTAGAATGIDADSGDQWPPIDLASVLFEGAPPRSTVTPRSIGLRPPPSEHPTAETQPPRAPAGGVSPPVPPATSGTCDFRKYQTAPVDSPLDSNRVRLIRFNNHDFGEEGGGEHFGIHVENFRMTDRAGKPIAVSDLIAEGRTQRKAKSASAIASISLDDPCWRAAVGEQGDPAQFARFYPSFKMDGAPNLTVAYGAREHWLLVNDSDECHNFHIHQTKFVVLDADFSAAGARPAAIQCLGDRGFVPPVNRGLLHDNYPLPPRARVLVMIRFEGPKLGRFVFHCHILEHEDKGMMATIGVVDGREH
jgi:FtsP/CotA-like multicopper oxidase with cupredoxin domain